MTLKHKHEDQAVLMLTARVIFRDEDALRGVYKWCGLSNHFVGPGPSHKHYYCLVDCAREQDAQDSSSIEEFQEGFW